ncbi:hypothetical protein D9611_012156 [Ephemerocybe angulata]|uniref:Protein kinase domain-containing protein n=1 Tax=Ephemerocybe angulata TaxID=980116 RepID=A0A8H5C593_9AGAR|nr:hypothetical protein D9611_012156 [Tulosesus angulatus]
MPSNERSDKEKKPFRWGSDEEMQREADRQVEFLKKLAAKTEADFASRPVLSQEEYLDMLVLYQASHDTPVSSSITSASSRSDRYAEKQRRLVAPTTKHRKIFGAWLRHPDGEILRAENSAMGKMAGNGIQLWGETLWDFYWTGRIPNFPYSVSVTTGSKMLEWVKKHGRESGEDQWEGNKSMRKRASRERPPIVETPFPVSTLLREAELGRSSIVEMGKDDSEVGQLPFGKGLPSSELLPTPVLQDRIPLHLLPKRLLVHDPHKLLTARHFSSGEDPSWAAQPDLVSTYALSLTDVGTANLEAELKELEKKKRNEQRHLEEWLKNPTAETRPENGVMFIAGGTRAGKSRPATLFMHEAKPPKGEKLGSEGNSAGEIEEAHLYLRPSGRAGIGNHSVVYNAEWEVPADLIVDPILCKTCVREAGMAILEAEDGKDGEKRSEKWNKLSGRVVEQVEEDEGHTICVFDDEGEDIGTKLGIQPIMCEVDPPSRKVTRKYLGPVRVVDTGVKWQSAARGGFCSHVLKAKSDSSKPAVKPPLKKTARLSIVAKLSLMGDMHLEREAGNYQNFPSHFYEHWNGYNITPPLHDPTPVGALVPMFYGYYVPVEGSDGKERVREWDRELGQFKADVEETQQEVSGDAKEGEEGLPGNESATNVDGEDPSKDPEGGVEGDGSEKGDIEVDDNASSEDDGAEDPDNYRSPILLMESCGESMCDIIDTMSIDDRQQCASLFFRLHYAGWVHHSAASRNILYQPGPLTAHPLERQKNATKTPSRRQTSFRLIDFGRSKPTYGEDGEDTPGGRGLRGSEEQEIVTMFRVMHMDDRK